MVKVYANEEMVVIESKELRDELLYIGNQTNEAKRVLMYKDFANAMREALGTSLLISINPSIEGETESVAVLTYNIVAGQYDCYQQGLDENGAYLMIEA